MGGGLGLGVGLVGVPLRGIVDGDTCGVLCGSVWVSIRAGW